MAIITVNGVDCYYDSSKALENVRLEIERGDFVGIIGPNGSGKTTLLRAIGGALSPRKGAIYVENVDVSEISKLELAKKMAVVPQDTNILFDFTAFDIVMMGRNPHVDRLRFESEKDIQTVKKAMELTSSLQFADRPIAHLSAGERQRVAIARALAQEPEIILLDEPTSHLDISFQLETMELLLELSEKSKLTIISVFHDLNLAAVYCKKLLLLKDGRVMSYGNGSDVLKPEIIRDAYSVDVEIKNHPLTGSPYIVPLSKTFRKDSKKNLKVHVICGGGTGSALFRLLSEEGYIVSAGVLSWPDSDYEYAGALGIDVVGEAPFCSVGEQSYMENLARIRDADIVILTDIPVSTGNIKNLEAFKMAVFEGKFALSISQTSLEKRDFAGGRAVQLLNEIYSMNVMRVADVRSAIKALSVK
jgi:iron complex transport system ATP-binding protein